MNTVYHCGKTPDVICEAATLGAQELPCNECQQTVTSGKKTKERKLLRKEVVAVAENDPEYGRCSTCRHYQHLFTCGECSNGSRYSFDWRRYAEEKQL